ncbi:EAL domain-containing protein [Alteromonas facilis]|uniref:EAL domain-containing protein n=1 Tax=Alteromonas facilis TaxID=2048004 RepID=UPI000F5D3F55|nr:EAL domain-containing protein [Alteromonas facilis]
MQIVRALNTLMTSSLLTFLLWTVSFCAVSQNFKPAFVGTDLQNASVSDITEDAYGFIWTHSSKGITRFDGYKITSFEYDPNVDGSLQNGVIEKLLADQLGRIWVAGSQGLSRYDDKHERFIRYTAENSPLMSGDVTAIALGHNGTLLIADSDGLYRFTIADNSLKRLNVSNFPPAQVSFIQEDNEKIWLSTKEQGTYALDKNTLSVFDLNDVNPWNIQFYQSSVYAIQRYDGSEWIGTQEGLFEILSTGGVRNVFSDDLGKIEVRDIHVIDDTLWLTTSSGVLTMGHDRVIKQRLINSVEVNSRSNYLMSMHVDTNGVKWIGTFNGVFRGLPYTKEAPQLISSVNVDAREVPVKEIWSIKQASDGALWFVSSPDKIVRMPNEDGQSQIFNNLANSPIWDIVLGAKNDLWIASSNGIFHFSINTDGSLSELAHLYAGSLIDKLYASEQAIWFWHDSLDLVRIDLISGESKATEAPTMITTAMPIGEDALGRIWLNSNMGAVVFEANTSLFEAPFQSDVSHPLHAEELRYFYAYAGHYYVVSATKGVYKLSKSDLSVVDYLASNVSDVMSGIGVDDSIWYSGIKTIHEVRLPQLEHALSLTSQRFANNEHFDSAITSGNDGAIYFGGEKGITRIYPSYLLQPTLNLGIAETPQLLSLKIFNTAIAANDSADSILKAPIYLSDSIKLEYKERFSVEYGVINPIDIEQTNYRHKLVGFDDDWVYNDTNRIEGYSRVPFGEYVFEVQSRVYDSDWSDSRKLHVTIEPPIWLHRHAIVFYAFFIVLTTIYLVRQYQSRKSSQLAIRESEERLKLTLWSSGDELWDWDIYGGQVHRSNTWGTLDFPQDDIRTSSSYEANIHPNDIERVREALQSHLDGMTEFFEVAYRAKTFKGEWIWLLDRGKVVKRDQNNNALRMTGTLKDIQHLKLAEEQLYLFKRSIENISEGVFITNTDFRFVSVNNAYCKYTGETREKALASYLFFHQYPDAFTDEIKKALRQKGNWSGEVESLRANGERFEIELNIDAVVGDDNKTSHYVGVFSDITSRKNTEKELLKLANVDPLTDLPNRSFFQASHHNLVRKNVPHTLICLDMDNFKKINDSLGHQTGDILIKQIARRVQRITGSSATCYRLGGDEFSLLIENKEDVHTITHFAQSILDALSRPFVINKQEFVLSASLGIAFFPEDGRSPQELLKNADTAMYFAKNGGGNSYQFFSGEMNQNAVRQLQIENLIRQGLRDNLFTVFYQPKVDITSGKLVSMEALVRFEHPQKGIVSPNQFIPLAEQTGQIVEIGEQVLRKACEDTKRWVQEGLFTGRVAVNISAKQFELPDLDDRIDQILRQVGLSPLHLECEITEGTLMENPEQGLKLMQRLRERGIHLALDDFGTGYSSLAYLKRFPLNTLKIDKAFIDDIAESSVDRHMAAAIINIAHNLGLKVVAEGVEQEKQLSILRRYDCEMIQGYLYSKPLSAEKFEKLLRENQKLHQLIAQNNV